MAVRSWRHGAEADALDFSMPQARILKRTLLTSAAEWAMRRLAFIILGLAPLVGCGPAMEWTKPNMSLAELQADRAECASLARDQAFRDSFYSQPFFVPWSRYGDPWWPRSYYGGPFGDPMMYRAQRENELQSFCLRSRGYHLAPVQQP
ncbi:MAG TPA: hypothetical protein VF194_13160 [Ferrovibrio sp.]|uniref:hypothetical protein n=1 Tax=Ferrovibrio sp. TaxID=1917215 RepID=UPI002ECFBC8A